MKKIIIIACSVLAFLVVLSFAKDMMIKAALEGGMKAATGLSLKMQDFKVGIIRTLVGIKGLKLYNPAGYQDKVMLDMPEIYLDYDLIPALGGKIRVGDLRINMKELVVVKNRSGEININSLNVVKDGKTAKKPAPGKKAGKPLDMYIKTLGLKIGKVVYKDYSQGDKPVVSEVEVNMDEEFHNIGSVQALAGIILVKALSGTVVGRLSGVDMKALKDIAGGALSGAKKTASDAAASAQEQLKSASQETRARAGEALKKAQKAAEDAEAALKKKADGLKLPFGKE